MAQILSQIIGNERPIERLKDSLSNGRFFPVQIFSGPESVGKSLVAKGLSQTILCEKQMGCGQCASCLRVEMGQHESLLWISNQTAQIKMEQAQSILEFLRLKSHRRCIVIDDAATLTGPAANTLLKSLEEAPENTYFFLVTAALHGVLITIRSRAQVTRFQGLTKDQLRRLLAETPEWILEASGGSLSAARALEDDEAQSLRARAYEILLHGLQGVPALCREKIAEMNVSQEQALLLVRLWRQMLRDLSLLGSGVTDSVIHRDLILASSSVPRETLDRAFRFLVRAEDDLFHHVDKNLVFENFAYGNF